MKTIIIVEKVVFNIFHNRFSGITEEDLTNVTTSLMQVQVLEIKLLGLMAPAEKSYYPLISSKNIQRLTHYALKCTLDYQAKIT